MDVSPVRDGQRAHWRADASWIMSQARAFARAHPVLAATPLVLALCWVLMLSLDRPLARLFGAAAPERVVRFFEAFTDLGLAAPYVWTALGVFVLGRVLFLRSVPAPICALYHRAALIAAFVLASLAASGLVIHLLKAVLGRLRPKHFLEEGLYGFAHGNPDWTTTSFPSGHTQTVFAVMTALSLLFPRAMPYFLGFAALIGLSRVGVSAHFLSDVIFGAFAGGAAAFVLWRTVFRELQEPWPHHLLDKGALNGKGSA